MAGVRGKRGASGGTFADRQRGINAAAPPPATHTMSHPDDNADPWIGRTLGGEFVVKRLLGSGGFGAVYIAEQTGVGREVVVKLIRRVLTENADVVERFKREARIAARLAHPNVVQLFTAGQTDDGAHYLVMEYVPGPTLHELLWREAPFDEVRALRIGEQIAAALAAAHGAGIVHRDLKPANVILTAITGRAEHAKVLDFGIAKLLEQGDDGPSLTATGAIVGTPAYMSPEQVSGQPLDGRSDIYTLGLMLYEMATGKHPFDANTPVQYIIQHLQQPITPPSVRTPGVHLSAEFESILQRCLAKSPNDRFASAEAVHTAMKRLADRMESAADPPTNVRPSAAPDAVRSSAGAGVAVPSAGGTRKGPVLAVVMVLAVSLFAAIGLLIFALGGGSEPTARSAATDGSTPDDKPDDAGALAATPDTAARSRSSAAATDGGAAAPVPDEGRTAATRTTTTRTAPVEAADPSAAAGTPAAAGSASGKPPSAQPSTTRRNPAAAAPALAATPTGTWTGPAGALLPDGAHVRMNTDSLVTYLTPYGVPALAEFFHEAYRGQSGVMFNMDDANDPDDPFFSLLLPRVETGVHMISIIHEGAGRARVNYFVR